MNDLDKIAAECWEKLRTARKGAPIAIIKSACEKAYDWGWHEGVRQCSNKQRIEAATASEQGVPESVGDK